MGKGIVMDREKKIKDSLIVFRNRWMEQKLGGCREGRETGLYEKAEKLLCRVLEQQRIKEAGEMEYIALFHYRSSLWTGTYRYGLCAWDTMPYIAEPMASEDWIPEWIYEDVPLLRERMRQELKPFVRLNDYELDGAVRTVLEEYTKIVEAEWFHAVMGLVQTEVFQEITKKESWRILFGTYMDEMKIVISKDNRW